MIKKIFSSIIMLILLLLVGCTTSDNKLPDLKDDEKVDMTAEEKVEFLQTVVTSNDEVTNNFKLDTFLDLEFALTNEMSFTSDGMSMENNTTVTLDADFNMTNYIEIGESNADTYVYSKFNKFEFNMLNDTYSSTSFGEEPVVVDTATTIDASLTNTFFLARSDYAYYQLNGRYNVEVKQGNKVVDETSQTETYANLQQKIVDGQITQEMYLELMASILELQQSLMIDVNAEMTAEERAQMLDMVDTHVNIYSSGTVHTIQFLITQDKVAELIDELFVAMTTELQDLGDQETLNNIKTSMKAAFKAFNFDFRIILEGELEGTKTLTKIEMMITGDFSGFTMSLDEEQSGGFPVLMKLTVKLNKLGFTLDFNADPLTLPSDTELEGFELVEKPPFVDMIDGIN